MRLDELLETKYSTSGKKTPNTIADVYGIIYRIYCIPENKSYVGQTFSHHYCGSYLSRTGILKRVKQHWVDKDKDLSKDRPLYKDLCKYSPSQFEIHEEKTIYGKDLANISQYEQEYMKKWNCLDSKGYNMEEIGKIGSKLITMLSQHYEFDIVKTKYEDEKTRERRCKDVCLGVYFNITRREVTLKRSLELLKTIDIENIRLINSGGYRILIKPRGENVNIRLYFKGTKDECLEYTKSISDKIELAPSFIGNECYRYQDKIDKVLENAELIQDVKGSVFLNKTNDTETYLLIFYGVKNKRRQSINRVSFGGKNISISVSYNIAVEFVDIISKNEKMSHIKINLNQINIE